MYFCKIDLRYLCMCICCTFTYCFIGQWIEFCNHYNTVYYLSKHIEGRTQLGRGQSGHHIYKFEIYLNYSQLSVLSVYWQFWHGTHGTLFWESQIGGSIRNMRIYLDCQYLPNAGPSTPLRNVSRKLHANHLFVLIFLLFFNVASLPIRN